MSTLVPLSHSAGLSPHPEAGTHNAGLVGFDDILSVYLAKALQYRPKLMMG